MGIYVDWDDLYAMARGANDIYIVARDKKGNLLESFPLGFIVLDTARNEAERLSVEVFEMSKNYRVMCLHEEASNDIVI